MKKIKVTNVEYLDEKYDQWDLTTKYSNFIVKIGDKEIVVHNSPAIVAGWLDNKFFVASKSLFNKTPKINFTEDDIDRNHPTGPNRQLKICLKYLHNIIPSGKIYQGDYLFDTSTLKSNGNLYTFQPNTIIYTTDKNSDIGKQIAKAKMGICFHTEYIAKSADPKDISLLGFNVKVSSLLKNSGVFLLSSQVENVSKNVTFSSSELTEYNASMRRIKSFSINWKLLNDFSADIMKFNNVYVKSGKYGTCSPIQMATDFILHTQMDFPSDIRKAFTDIFELLLLLVSLKTLLMNKLKNISSLDTFVQKSNGDLIVTSQEGYVITTGPAQSTKLVSRLEFSRNNFSSDIIKGFQR